MNNHSQDHENYRCLALDGVTTALALEYGAADVDGWYAEREGKALKLYNELLAQAEDEDAKHLFKLLCQEEARHKLILETKYDDYMAEMGD